MTIEEQYLQEATALLTAQKYTSAGIYARKILKTNPEHSQARKILANIALRQGNIAEAYQTYLAVLASCPQDIETLKILLEICERQEDLFNAFHYLEQLCQLQPEQYQWQLRLGLIACRIGNMQVAETNLLNVINVGYSAPQAKLNLGHVYKAMGAVEKAAGMYHEFINTAPSHQATGYWSLADLKRYQFTDSELDILHTNATDEMFSAASRSLFQFSLCRAYEQRHRYSEAFNAAKSANELMSPLRPFKKRPFNELIERLLRCRCHPQTSSDETPWTPIFIVGMPRSGTTLTEQILACHPQVHTTDELPYIERLALQLEMHGGYAERLAQLTASQIKAMRAMYLSQTSQYLPKTIDNNAYVIDKNPNNFMHIGLIKTLFPEAKIINVVRNACDNALGVFKQHFSHGHDYSYSLDDICLYWQQYLHLMEHWAKRYGAEIYHLSFEQLVTNPESQIRELLTNCGLSFVSQCLEFYNSDRRVLTPSASQVRQPMNPKVIGQSTHYQQFMLAHYEQLTTLARRANSQFFE
ncbi:sulfotransferase [Shewanella yunxiaonensis]|uniref:Sulfotransferase n=1 Tax=Shewanella yunxiaonensis TaxID=2829809 RepID=A0ABX7YUN1_9GAMM|nr:sulfotransferase [Shewanella yunxiaonensis]QUN06034.1 sulfotransferase [Shewanella yunxiaonensis]